MSAFLGYEAHTLVWKLNWPLDIWYMDTYPGVGTCPGYYNNCHACAHWNNDAVTNLFCRPLMWQFSTVSPWVHVLYIPMVEVLMVFLFYSAVLKQRPNGQIRFLIKFLGCIVLCYDCHSNRPSLCVFLIPRACWMVVFAMRAVSMATQGSCWIRPGLSWLDVTSSLFSCLGSGP